MKRYSVSSIIKYSSHTEYFNTLKEAKKFYSYWKKMQLLHLKDNDILELNLDREFLDEYNQVIDFKSIRLERYNSNGKKI